MSVAVCEIDELPAQVIGHAEAEATYVFQAMAIEVHWTSCGAEVDASDARTRPDFIVRVRAGGHVTKAGPTSLEAMGRAFMNADDAGSMADVYYGAIRELTLLDPVASAEQVMGYTMAHDLGHLLIGAGHRPNGLMRAAMGKKELNALNQRHLKFNEAEQATILRKVRSRVVGSK